MNNSLILIIVSSALVNNVLLSRFWGVCSFLGVSKQMKASASLGVAVIFVMTIASAVASLLNDYVLKPFGLPGIHADHRLHPGHRGPGADRGDVPQEELPGHL